MTTSLKFKEKTTELDTRSYKCLLLALVKLIHADPKLMLHVSLTQHRSQMENTLLFFSSHTHRMQHFRTKYSTVDMKHRDVPSHVLSQLPVL